MADKRKYTKKSDYWKKFENSGTVINAASNIEPVSAGDNYYVSTASCFSGSNKRTAGRSSNKSNSLKNNKYTNIREGMLPYSVSRDGVDVREAIELCQKAYANVPIFRNAIDIMAELANSPIYVEGGNEASRNFVEKWFSKINLWSLKDQYFREYYRSGNVFLYRLDGKFTTEDFIKLNKIYGSENMIKPNHIPVRYVLLNPYDIIARRSTSFKTNSYQKLLSEYELERLQTPKTEDDKEILNSLPEEVRKKIKDGGWTQQGVNVDLDPQKLSVSFYKKQDYEPFAIPFGFPVLDDINWKIELKKVDQAISRTIENVILLITMGNDPDKGGINPNNLQAMQCLFQNESVGRVLVADYTTKAEFILPDISKIIGPQKYEIVNEDIRQGLQNVIVGDEKYKNTQVKAEIFLERLKEARQSFVHNFLQPQIKLVCQHMGFKSYPTAKFEEIDIKDEVQLQRVTTRLMELGILTPEQGIQTIKTGLYPENNRIGEGQEQYVEDRQKGHYTPLVGGQPLPLDEEEVAQAPAQNPNSQRQPSNTPQQPGRPSGTNKEGRPALANRKSIQNTIYATEGLFKFAQVEMKKANNIKRLSKDKKSLLEELCKTVVISCEKSDWEKQVKSCVADFNHIENLSPLPEILNISSDYEIELYPSALYYHSNDTSQK